MPVFIYDYVCETCFATKQLLFDTEYFKRPLRASDLPDELLCGVRGCEGPMVRVYDDEGRRVANRS